MSCISIGRFFAIDPFHGRACCSQARLYQRRRFGFFVDMRQYTRQEEGYEADEDIQLHRRHITYSFAGQVGFGKIGRPEQQVFDRAPEITFVMGKVFDKVAQQVSERLTGFDIFLAAGVAETVYFVPAILTYFFLA